MSKCTECGEDVGETPYNPMPEWKMKAPLCGKCYSTAGVVVGGKVPVVITSRSDEAQARLASIAAAVVALD